MYLLRASFVPGAVSGIGISDEYPSPYGAYITVVGDRQKLIIINTYRSMSEDKIYVKENT